MLTVTASTFHRADHHIQHNQPLRRLTPLRGRGSCYLRGGRLHLLFEVEHGAQCDVDLHEFLRVQVTCEVAEALRVNGGGLLDQYPDVLAEKLVVCSAA
jgi:hypothetical protein